MAKGNPYPGVCVHPAQILSASTAGTVARVRAAPARKDTTQTGTLVNASIVIAITRKFNVNFVE